MAVLLAAPIASAPFSSALAASVPIRAAAHKDFGRMVFDWPAAVDFTARVEGERLVVSFTQPIEASLDRTVAALSGYLSAGRVEADGKTVSFDLKRPVTLKSFRNGKSVAIDLSPASAEAAAKQAAATPPTPTPSAPTQAQLQDQLRGTPAPEKPAADKPVPSAGRVAVKAGDQPDLSRVAFEWPAPVDYSVKRDGAAVTVTFDKGGSADLTQAAKANLRNVRNIEQYRQPNGALAVTFAVPQDAEVKDSKAGKTVVLDVMNAGTRKAPDAPAGTVTTVRPDARPDAAPAPPA
ncbi:tetratricopeptide repeat protein, partial [Azospirillum doebereinerae]|nr:tetratricopeptide repeat protein [Azospirillum doebereinerae]